MPTRGRRYRPPTSFSVFPPVIKNLLILNGLVFLAQITGLQTLLLRWFALWPIGSPDTLMGATAPGFWPWQLVTYAFLHANFTHILFNMFALWMFGVQIENVWGSRRFTIYYFVCVIGAAAAQLAVTYGSTVPTLGASGGVFGVLAAFGMMFPNQRIMLLFPPIPIKAKWFVIGYGALELFLGVTGAGGAVARFAHLGGLAIGVVLIQYWRGKLPVKPEHRLQR